MTKQIDSYKKSLFEAFTNLLGGYPMMFVAGIVILPLSAHWIKEDPLVANITITGVYASINFTRSFLLRRLFAKYEIHNNFITLVKNLVRK
jgi:hypothetical protein